MRVDTATRGNRSYRVWVDDQEIKGCVMADDELGHVERHVRDANGRLVIDRQAGRVVTETLRGRVFIERIR